ncbi:hypothetical protein EXS71_01520 [Candidatus Uhrbacteria bacterium]|nr:hypothetical protein [Candidatus Uhrbacteria bacterium]
MGIFDRFGFGRGKEKESAKPRAQHPPSQRSTPSPDELPKGIARSDVRGDDQFRPDGDLSRPSYKDMDEAMAKRFLVQNGNDLVFRAVMMDFLLRDRDYRAKLSADDQIRFERVMKSKSLAEALQNRFILEWIRPMRDAEKAKLLSKKPRR